LRSFVGTGEQSDIVRNENVWHDPPGRSVAAIGRYEPPVNEDILCALLTRTIEDDPYPLSPRLGPLKSILAKLSPEPIREPLRPPKVYAPPRATAARRRRG
jgi:hypothetical protein